MPTPTAATRARPPGASSSRAGERPLAAATAAAACRPRAAEDEPRRAHREGEVQEPARGDARPRGERLGVAPAALGIGDRLDEAPRRVAGEPERDDGEQRPPERRLEQGAQRAARVGGAAAGAERRLRGEQPDGRVEHRLGRVAHARQPLDPRRRVADGSLDGAAGRAGDAESRLAESCARVVTLMAVTSVRVRRRRERAESPSRNERIAPPPVLGRERRAAPSVLPGRAIPGPAFRPALRTHAVTAPTSLAESRQRIRAALLDARRVAVGTHAGEEVRVRMMHPGAWLPDDETARPLVYLASMKTDPKIREMTTRPEVALLLHESPTGEEAASWEMEVTGRAEVVRDAAERERAKQATMRTSSIVQYLEASGQTDLLAFVRVTPRFIKHRVFGEIVAGRPPSILEFADAASERAGDLALLRRRLGVWKETVRWPTLTASAASVVVGVAAAFLATGTVRWGWARSPSSPRCRCRRARTSRTTSTTSSPAPTTATARRCSASPAARACCSAASPRAPSCSWRCSASAR
jgi:hypothetical protein